MSLISLLEVTLSYGAQPLLDKANLAIEEGERICLVGRNGSGKSTLLKLIAGELEPDQGRRIVQNGLIISRLRQDPPDYAQGTVFSEICAAVPVVGKALNKIALGAQGSELTELSDFIERHDGWQQQATVLKIINQFELDKDVPLNTLSGGFRRKVALAASLVCKPQLLLLDEPTNHLDIQTIEWFEQWLLSFKGTVVFVTHDRAFANHGATRIVELDRGKLYSYAQRFEQYLQQRQERLRLEELSNQQFDRILAQEEAWIRRGVKARLARNEGRVRDLEQLREQRRQRRSLPQQVKLQVNTAHRSGVIIYELRQVGIKFADKQILEPTDLTVMRGDRIGIVGPNGVGKTSLIATLLGKHQPNSGYVRVGMNVEPIYFDQYHEQLNQEQSVADNVAQGRNEVVINGKTQHIISYLNNFLFTSKRARSPVSVLSGGEKNRLLLARLFARPSNVLIMDEPTNDLDLETLELLEDLVANYQGTVIVVSHDRHFIDKIATQTWVFEPTGHIEEIVGGWSDVLSYYQRIDASKSTATAIATAKNPTVQPQLKKNNPISGLSFTQLHELEQLPALIEKLEAQLELINTQLTDPQLYSQDLQRLQDINAEHKKLTTQLENTYARWEELEAKR